ncbi:hypothetical protein CLV56_1974 [Mumia flava]|uniref:TspO/MBR related protein n=1 Tax=Mumia flava TaxID=1348852 RepID=A0A0B2B6W1_9ACTN|nr:hypothetical protein [Mumia flava]PJJ57736.1 hypothetical protein CLV56_1974 [Mumia flava]
MTTSESVKSPTRPSRTLAWVVLVAVVLQIATPAVQAIGGLGDPPSSQGDDLLITPAGYTFSIWSLVYLLTLVHAVAVLIERSTGTAQPDRLMRDLLVVYLGAALWIVVAAAGPSWATAVVLVTMVVFAVDAARVASGPAADGGPTWLVVLVRVTTALYAGWVTAASILNVCTALVDGGALDGDDVGWQIGALVVAALVAVAISVVIGGSWVYAATLAWALVGIVVAVSGTSTPLVVTAIAAAAVVVLVNAALILRRKT